MVAVRRMQVRDAVEVQKQASRRQFAGRDCDGGYTLAERRDFGKASWVASDRRRDWLRRAMDACRNARIFDPRPAYKTRS